MAERTLVENVAQVKADFKAVKEAVPYVFGDNPPTSQYGERLQREISSLQYQADSAWYQGYNEGMEQGRQDERSAFWDSYQNYGNRVEYSYGFSNEGWNDSNFKPKYDMQITNYMFYNSRITNLADILAKQGVRLLRRSNSTVNMNYAFGNGRLTHIPEVDLTNATNTQATFNNSANFVTLQSIEKIISSETTVFTNNCFGNCGVLEHCIFEGTIASSINLQWSTKLSLESLLSLFRCLKRFTTDAFTKTITLSSESWSLLNSSAEFMEEYNGNTPEQELEYRGWNYQ